MHLRALSLPDPDPWMAALAVGADWLRARLPYGDADLARRAEMDHLDPGRRRALADALAAQAAQLGAGEASRAAIERLRDPRTLVVVAGQQAGALGGPGYTLLKAAGAVAYARRAQALLGRPVVPVFWTATEDHDVGEIQRLRLPLPGGGHRDFHLFQPVPAGRRPVGPMEAGDALRRLVREVRESPAMPGAHRQEVLDLAEGLIDGHPTVGGHFMALMARLFASTPLVLLDPMDEALRRLVADVFERALLDPEAVAAAARAGERAVAAVGREVQVPWQERETGVFALLDGERHMLEVEGADLVPRGLPGERAARAAWAERARRTPAAFSSAVHLRPVVQGALLPVLGVVLGPGEVRYHAQLRELFELFDVPVPVVWPRPRAVLVGGTARRLLTRLGLEVEDVLGGWQARLEAALAARDTVGIEAAFTRFDARLAAAHGELVATVAPLGRDLVELGEKNLRRMRDEAAWLRSKAEQALRQGNDTLVRQYRTVGEHLAPESGPQDRHLSFVAFLAQYGLDLGERLAASDDLCQGGVMAAEVVDAP
ncbi:MAG: bacillithiol biosynthesis cysteine-adding enzyme BshC [Firmicutes bacterium]|nr:bacillithiol biosynthesis cysteine-adding enzyme BshC [Bacillota bacterium]